MRYNGNNICINVPYSNIYIYSIYTAVYIHNIQYRHESYSKCDKE